MTKNIIIAVQFVLIVLFLVYALVQRTQAIKNEELAKRSSLEAVDQANRAMQQQKIAEAAQAALHDCQTH